MDYEPNPNLLLSLEDVMEQVETAVEEKAVQYPDSVLFMHRKAAYNKLRRDHPTDFENRLIPRHDIKLDWRTTIDIDYSRNDLLTEQSKSMLEDRYLHKEAGETDPQHLFARVACAGADDAAHAQRLYNMISRHWFMPATPVLTNLGTDRGLSISCFVNHVTDSLSGIISTWNETSWMGARGGGVGTYWGGVREISAEIAGNGKTSGIIPFIRVQDSLSLAINQGGVRRGSSAVYLDISHPEMEEFMKLRDPSGDYNRKALNLHNGVIISDAFMHAVRHGLDWELRSPLDGRITNVLDARDLFQRLVEMRLKTGEPYMLFIDTVNRQTPKHHRNLGLKVSTSNLCSEITLPTGRDHLGRHRSAVCCLSSINLIYWELYENDEVFFDDIFRFLDNVLTDFILRAPDALSRAVYSAYRERSVGLGVMGFHTMLQDKNVAFESALAKALNLRIFRKLRAHADRASDSLATERGACPDAIDGGARERFSCKLAIAPTASISSIAGGASPCIEPIPANVFTHKTLSGNYAVYNPNLKRHLAQYGLDNQETWSSILANGGSVQHLVDLPDHVKAIFKTAFEIDQRWLIEFAADRTPYICQAQSLNLYIPPTIDKFDLIMLHYQAWEKGVKSLYYLRSKSIQRAGNLFVNESGGVERDNKLEHAAVHAVDDEKYNTCLACQ